MMYIASGLHCATSDMEDMVFNSMRENTNVVEQSRHKVNTHGKQVTLLHGVLQYIYPL
jgi:hypothetical protein